MTLVTEQVEPFDLGVTWEPNAPSACLVSDDMGKTALALMPHGDDLDQRCVVILWSGTHSACLSDPNDEAISGHRLYAKGLADVLWAGVVRNSEAVAALVRQNAVHPFHDPSRFQDLVHHVLPMKECVAEVIAQTMAIRRFDSPTLEAAVTAMRG